MFLTVTEGEWLLPLLVFLAMLGIAEYIAKKKNIPKINKIINITVYAVSIGLLIIYWILYFATPKEVSLFNVVFFTIVILYSLNDKLLNHFKEQLKSKYRKLRIAIIILYILIIVMMILYGSHFSVVGWIIAVIVATIFGMLEYMVNQYE